MKAIGREKYTELVEILKKKGLDCVLLMNFGELIDSNIQYFSNFKQENGLGNCILILTKNERILILKKDENSDEVDVEKLIRVESFSEISNKFKKFKKIGINKYKLSVASFHFLKKIFKARFYDVGYYLKKIRAIKTNKEITYLKKAANISNKIIRLFESELVQEIKRKKITEREISIIIEEKIRRHGAEISFKTLVATGSRSSQVHTNPTALNKLAKKIGYVDFGAKFNGYHSDVTIPFVLRGLNSEERKTVDLLIETYEFALENLKVGMRDSKLFNLVNDFLKKHKIKLMHGLGHGLGLEIHELPSILNHDNKKFSMKFENGMVFTIEPGIYKRGFGLRIEDDFYFWKNKLIPLTKSYLIEDLKRK